MHQRLERRRLRRQVGTAGQHLRHLHQQAVDLLAHAQLAQAAETLGRQRLDRLNPLLAVLRRQQVAEATHQRMNVLHLVEMRRHRQALFQQAGQAFGYLCVSRFGEGIERRGHARQQVAAETLADARRLIQRHLQDAGARLVAARPRRHFAQQFLRSLLDLFAVAQVP